MLVLRKSVVIAQQLCRASLLFFSLPLVFRLGGNRNVTTCHDGGAVLAACGLMDAHIGLVTHNKLRRVEPVDQYKECNCSSCANNVRDVYNDQAGDDRANSSGS